MNLSLFSLSPARRAARALTAGALLLVAGAIAHADPFGFNVALDTSGLPTLASGNYSIYYYLSDGGTLNNNTVNISNVLFGGGTALGSPTLSGSTGSLSSGAHISDGLFLNEFTQGFTPGSNLSFNVSLPNVGVDAVPDHFGFQILDGSGNPIVSNDPTTGTDLVSVDLSNSHLTPGDVQTYGYTVNGTTYTAQITPLGAAPEPAFYQMSALLGCGAVALGLSRRRNRKSAAPTQAAA